jgi:glycosyltransferase involved in cell wall biosynthesis
MISVIIPVYNGSNFIQSIIKDLSKQRFTDFEVIVVNDGSTDETGLILEDIKKNFRFTFNILILNQKNLGVSAARNNGLKNSNGEFLVFIDVDDGIDENYLLVLHNLINDNNGSVAICKTKNYRDDLKENGIIKTYSKDIAMYKYLFGKIKTGVCGIIVRKTIFSNNNLEFPAGFKYSEDLYMLWKILFYSKKIITTTSKLYIYNDTNGSAMSKFNEYRYDSIKLMEDLSVFFQKKSIRFSKKFDKFAIPKMRWSLAWQAAHHNNYKVFNDYLKSYNLKKNIKNLIFYKNFKVVISSLIFLVSNRLFYHLARLASRNFRKAKGETT